MTSELTDDQVGSGYLTTAGLRALVALLKANPNMPIPLRVYVEPQRGAVPADAAAFRPKDGRTRWLERRRS